MACFPLPVCLPTEVSSHGRTSSLGSASALCGTFFSRLLLCRWHRLKNTRPPLTPENAQYCESSFQSISSVCHLRKGKLASDMKLDACNIRQCRSIPSSPGRTCISSSISGLNMHVSKSLPSCSERCHANGHPDPETSPITTEPTLSCGVWTRPAAPFWIMVASVYLDLNAVS